MRLIGGIALAALCLAGTASADTLEQEARAIEAMLVAPCCWSQQVSLHQSSAAAEIKDEVRKALRTGRTRQQILDDYVARYGTQILVEPPARGFGAWLYVLPVLTLVLSGAGVTLVVRRFTKRGAESVAMPQGNGSEDAELSEQLDEQLRDLD